MRVAFLTDVHGNLPALEAVLADARDQGVDAVWDGGDTVGYHPWPDQCVRLLHAACEITVQGNYDRKVLKTPRRRQRWRRRKDPVKAEALIWAWDELSSASRDLLAGRPAQVRRAAPCGEVLVCHASPLSRKEPLGPLTRPARWRALVAAAGAPTLVVHGHVHGEHAHREGPTLFLTPGSVGRSEDGDPRAAYLVLDLDGRRPRPTIRRVAYDTQRVADEVAARALPPEFGVMVLRGISLARARRLLRRPGR
ncbi:MAG: metallophosphoesterase family protein [Candidatus Krumholzibacteriia bacterium]